MPEVGGNSPVRIDLPEAKQGNTTEKSFKMERFLISHLVLDSSLLHEEEL